MADDQNTTETDDQTTDEPEPDEEGAEEPGTEEEPETFPRDYVEQLRAEAAEARVRAKRADDLARRLLEATVREATTGILADPTDLPVGDDLYDEDGYPDPDTVRTAATELVERKPHLADRRPTAPVEQGARDEADGVNLAGILRSRA